MTLGHSAFVPRDEQGATTVPLSFKNFANGKSTQLLLRSVPHTVDTTGPNVGGMLPQAATHFKQVRAEQLQSGRGARNVLHITTAHKVDDKVDSGLHARSLDAYFVRDLRLLAVCPHACVAVSLGSCSRCPPS